KQLSWLEIADPSWRYNEDIYWTSVPVLVAAAGRDEQRRGEAAPSFLTVWEGDSFVINCAYTDSASTYFFWYKQEPGKSLHLLIYTLSNVVQKQEQGLTVLLNKKDKHLSLQDTATHPGDSATYFCATKAPAACPQTEDWGGSPTLFPLSQAFKSEMKKLVPEDIKQLAQPSSVRD
uniref:Ig-like domain-containing protein n=1 Tax=Ailuropoda melanoleuca TaxID=9646 RepID=A0A7N5P1R3_AILME